MWGSGQFHNHIRKTLVPAVWIVKHTRGNARNVGENMRVLRPKETCERVKLTNQWLRKLEERGEFPRRIRLGPNSVGHLEHEVDDWLAARAAERDGDMPAEREAKGDGALAPGRERPRNRRARSAA